MLSSDLALPQHMPGHHLTQEKDRLRVHADAAIKTLARNLQEIATSSNTDPGIVNDTIDSSPGRRRCFNKLCMLGEIGDVPAKKHTFRAWQIAQQNVESRFR